MTAATNMKYNECRPKMLVFYNKSLLRQKKLNTDIHLLILCTPTTRVHMCFSHFLTFSLGFTNKA